MCVCVCMCVCEGLGGEGWSAEVFGLGTAPVPSLAIALDCYQITGCTAYLISTLQRHMVARCIACSCSGGLVVQQLLAQVAVERGGGGCHVIGGHILQGRVADAVPAAGGAAAQAEQRKTGLMQRIESGCDAAAAPGQNLRQPAVCGRQEDERGAPAAHEEHAHLGDIGKHHGVVTCPADQHGRLAAAAAGRGCRRVAAVLAGAASCCTGGRGRVGGLVRQQAVQAVQAGSPETQKCPAISRCLSL